MLKSIYHTFQLWSVEPLPSLLLRSELEIIWLPVALDQLCWYLQLKSELCMTESNSPVLELFFYVIQIVLKLQFYLVDSLICHIKVCINSLLWFWYFIPSISSYFLPDYELLKLLNGCLVSARDQA